VRLADILGVILNVRFVAKFNASSVEQDMKKLLHSSLNPIAMREYDSV
jgi:hypothetical protein